MKKDLEPNSQLMYPNIISLKERRDVRMLDLNKSVTVDAVLIKEVIFVKDSQDIFVPAGTQVKIELDNLIMTHGKDHTKVTADEFRILYPN